MLPQTVESCEQLIGVFDKSLVSLASLEASGDPAVAFRYDVSRGLLEDAIGLYRRLVQSNQHANSDLDRLYIAIARRVADFEVRTAMSVDPDGYFARKS